MSTHSYSRCWLHLIWETLRREPMLDKRAAARACVNLSEYSLEKGIYLKINYFNTDHTHVLIDLPTKLSIEQVIQLLKGSSSHWINQNAWSKGDSHGDAATELSRSRIQMLIASASTSRIKEHIIAREPLKTSINFLWVGMARRGKPLKTVN
jgi:REP element-mobilizing transposase RayT